MALCLRCKNSEALVGSDFCDGCQARSGGGSYLRSGAPLMDEKPKNDEESRPDELPMSRVD